MTYLIQQAYWADENWATIASSDHEGDAEDITDAMAKEYPRLLKFRFIKEGEE